MASFALSATTCGVRKHAWTKRLTDMNQFNTFQTIQQPAFIFSICYLKIIILKNILKSLAQMKQMGSWAWIVDMSQDGICEVFMDLQFLATIWSS